MSSTKRSADALLDMRMSRRTSIKLAGAAVAAGALGA